MLAESALTSLESLINRQVEASTPARGMLARLEGRSFAVALQGGGSATLVRLHILASREGLRLSLGSTVADANVRGSASSLMRLLAGRADGGHHQPGVTVDGDATVVQGFEQLFRHARPDVEAEVARLLGDLPAHFAIQAARTVFATGQRVFATVTRSSGEYLVEESRDVIGRDELAVFLHDVDRLRDDVARIEARIDQLAAARLVRP